MADIAFSENIEGVWVGAGWAFRQVLQDVIMQYEGDSEMVAELNLAEAVGYLHVDSLDNLLAVRVVNAFKDVASGILVGRIRSGIFDRYGDEATTEEYRKGLVKLLEAVPA